jgi:hypothetical protein
MEVAAIARHLPAGVAASLAAVNAPRSLSLDELFERSAAREGVEVGFGREHAAVVLGCLGRALGDDARALLRRHLPPAIGALLEPRPDDAPDDAEDDVRAEPWRGARGRDLASGRPGASAPLSEAAPRGAHTHSVARASNPHGDTKLSSARGPR